MKTMHKIPDKPNFAPVKLFNDSNFILNRLNVKSLSFQKLYLLLLK